MSAEEPTVFVCPGCGAIVDPRREGGSHEHPDPSASQSESDAGDTDDAAQRGESETAGETMGAPQSSPQPEAPTEENIASLNGSHTGDRDMSDWYGTDAAEQHDTPLFVDNSYADLQEAHRDPETELEQRKHGRDERQRTNDCDVTQEEVRDQYDDRLAEEVSDTFQRIKTRERPQPATSGPRVHTRNLIRRHAGNRSEDKLYEQTSPSESGDRTVTVVVDASNSMDELEVKLALTSLAEACRKIGDNFAAVNYRTINAGYGTTGEIVTRLITGPTESFRDTHLDSFQTGGVTPTASGIQEGRSIAETAPNSEQVIIVITDGIANVTLDCERCQNRGGTEAMKESHQQLNVAQTNGKRIIGLGVGRELDDEQMQEIFGSDYIRADMEQMGDALLEIYKDQMDTPNP